mgnify:CR=1 FL=1
MMSKSQVVLYIYDVLIKGGKIKTDEILNEFEISLRTFQRYIAEINDFFFNNFMNYYVKYDYELKYYYLVNTR